MNYCGLRKRLFRLQWADLPSLGLAMLALGTAWHGFHWWFPAGGRKGFDYAERSTKLGVPVEQLVTVGSGDSVQTLSAVHRGYCRYVIIGSSICSFSKRLAVEWTVTSLREPTVSLLPEKWKTFWVLVEPGEVAAEFRDPQFPVSQLRPWNNSSFMTHVGITGFPYHLVLDRNGLVLEAGTGGQLHDREAFNSDCTVRVPADDEPQHLY